MVFNQPWALGEVTADLREVKLLLGPFLFDTAPMPSPEPVKPAISGLLTTTPERK